MDNLAINDQPKALSQYSRHQIDRTYADQYESVLGHLICERGRSVKAALEDLRPIVSQTRRETLSAIDWCQKLGFGGLGVGILVGAGMGMGFAILPILAGTISIKFWADSRSELPRRDAEYHLLKTTPNLPEALYALHLRGVTAVKIVGAYDQLVAAIEARLEGNGEFTEAEVGEFLQVKVSGDMGLETSSPATVSAETQAQSGIQNSDASNAPRTESPALAPTELQAIAPGVVAVAPSMGVSRIMSPLEILIRARFSHRAFYGGQRTGKSYLAAIASQALSLTGIKVFHMNLFSHGPEDKKYWTHAARSVQCDLSSISPNEAAPFIRQAQAILSEFKQTKDALLIVDEITSMGNLRSEHLENLQPFINGLVSYINAIRDSSKKRHKAVWTIAPGIVSAGLDQGVKELIKGLSPVLVSIPKDVSILWEDQALTTDMTVYGQLKINYQGITEPPVMDCDRMVLIDNIWMPMGTLPPLTKIAPPSLSDEVLEVQSPSQPIAPPSSITEPWESDEPIEVCAVEVEQSHPLADKFDRLESLMDGKDSLPIREIQRAFSCKSDEAQQIAQMFCFKQKSTYRFSQLTNPNGTLSKSIERV